MRFPLMIFVSIVGLTASLPAEYENQVETMNSPAGTRNTALEQLVLDILEQVREVMKTGTDDIPVLDPLTIGNARLEGRIFNNDAHIEVTNLKLDHLSTFVIDTLSISLGLIRYTVEFEAHLPEIEYSSEKYDLSVTASGFTVFGNGDVTGKLGGARVKASIVLAPRISLSGLFVQINSADIKVALDTFKPTFTGFFGNEPATEFINSFLANLLPELLEYFEADISAIINEVVMVYGNQILADLDIGSILSPLGSGNVEKMVAIIEGDLEGGNPEILRLPRKSAVA